MKNKSIYAAVLTAAFALTAVAPATADDLAPADTGGTVNISGSAGERQTADGSSLRLRYVGNPPPAGYDGNYQHGKSVTTPSPEDGPVTMSGTLDISGMTASGDAAIIGLYDLGALADGATAHKKDAGIWVSYSSRSGGYYDIGVTDGDAGGGEWVQRFTRIAVADIGDGVLNVNFVVDGTADPTHCVSTPADLATADGCMTLTVNGTTVTDSYGSVSPDGVDVELANGGHPGWWVGYGSAGPVVGVLYNLDISPATPGLESKGQCKGGGFAAFGYTNQGQCVASLNGRP
ncbi:MAG: hypothetical protein WED09_01715 [Homoserinimonas sp.]